MAGGTVGRIGIRVFPDLDSFNEKLKAGLEKAERKYKVEIPVHLKSTKAQMLTEARTARDSAQEQIDNGNVKIRVPLGVNKDKETDTEIRTKVDEVNARLSQGNVAFEVPIKVDRTALAADLKFALREAKRELTAEDRKIVLNLDLDKTGFKRKFEELKSDYDGKNIDLKADVDRTGKAEASLALLSRNRYVDLIVRIEKRSLATARGALAALTGVNILQSTGRSLENFALNIDRYAGRFAAIGLVLAGIASNALALVSSMVGLFADLGKLGGFALAIPTAAASVAAFAVAGVMAFKGFKDAVGGSVEALNKLPPQAQAAARALQGTWTAMQVPVQAAFWAQMGTAFEDLVQRVFPEVQIGMQKVGAASGKMLHEVIAAFVDLSGDRVFSGMFDNLAVGLGRASFGIRPFIGAIIELGSVGSQYLPKVGDWIKDISRTFADWVQRSSDAGKINLWMENAADAAGNLGQAFKSAGGALSNIVDSTRTAGSGNLETLANTMERVRRIADSNTFRFGMTNIFGGAHEAVQLMKGSIGDLGHALSDLSPVIRGVLVTSGVVISTLISNLSKAATSSAFKNGLADFFQGIQNGIQGLVQFLPKVVDGLGDLGSLVGRIAQEFGPVVGQAFGGVADLFRNLSPAIKDLVPVLATFASNSLQTLFTVLQPISDGIRLIINLFNALPGPIQTAVIALAVLIRLLGGGPAIFRPFLNQLQALPGQITSAFRQAQQVTSATPLINQSAMSSALGRQLTSVTTSAFTGATTAMNQSATAAFAKLPSFVAAGVSANSSTTRDAITRAIVPPGLSGTVSQQVSTAVGQIRFAPAVNSMIAQANAASTTGWARFGASMTSGLTGAMGSLNGIMRSAGASVVAAASGLWTTLGNGFKSMYSVIGGGAGVALIGVFTLISSYSQQAREIESNNRSMSQSFEAMGKAAFDAGQKISGIAGQQSAADALAPLLNMRGGNFRSFFDIGGADTSTLDDFLAQGGFTTKDMSKYMSGVSVAGMDSFIQTMKDRMDSEDGFALSRNFIFDATNAQRDSQKLGEVFQGLSEAHQKASKELERQWDIDPQAGALNVIKNLRDQIGEGQKVTIGAVSGIEKGVGKLPMIGKDAISQFAGAFTAGLGGGPEAMAKSFTVVQDSLLKFGTTAGDVAKNDYMREIVKNLVLSGEPVSRIKTALQEFGFTAEEAGRLIQFRFGPALSGLGKPITVLGEQIPKLNSMSSGINEVADALSAASGIDSSKLAAALSLGGADPVKTARALAEAGVAFGDIQKAMEAMGVPSATAAAALAQIQSSLQQTNRAALDQGAMATYSKALDQIRTSADGATGRAQALLLAIDQLKGGLNESANVGVAFGSALEGVKKLGAEGSTALLNLSQAIDPALGKINFFAPGLEASNSALNNMAQTGLAAVIQSMKDSAVAGGDFNAQIAAGQAVIDQNLNPALAALRQGLEDQQAGTQVTDQVWQQLLATYHLTPDQVITLAIAQTSQANTDVRGLISTIGGVPGQPSNGGPVVAVFDSLTQGALAKANELKIAVRQTADGKYELTMSADTNTARNQAQGLVNYVNGLSATVDIRINTFETRRINEVIQASKPGGNQYGFNSAGGFANGGILNRVGRLPAVKAFANGGVEDHRAHIAKAGTYRVFAEKETGGEAYIPLSPWKRERSMSILREVADRFGVALVAKDRQVRRYSQGSAGSSSSDSNSMPPISINNWNNHSNTSPGELYQELNRRWALHR